MLKIFLSIIEGVIGGIITWKVAIPFFLSLAHTEIGGWAYWGLFCFLIIIIGAEYASYKEDELTYVMSLILGEALDK